MSPASHASPSIPEAPLPPHKISSSFLTHQNTYSTVTKHAHFV